MVQSLPSVGNRKKEVSQFFSGLAPRPPVVKECVVRITFWEALIWVKGTHSYFSSFFPLSHRWIRLMVPRALLKLPTPAVKVGTSTTGARPDPDRHFRRGNFSKHKFTNTWFWCHYEFFFDTNFHFLESGRCLLPGLRGGGISPLYTLWNRTSTGLPSRVKRSRTEWGCGTTRSVRKSCCRWIQYLSIYLTWPVFVP